MGGANSTNITELTTNALSESTNTFMQKLGNDPVSRQGIYVYDTNGNVVISGNEQDAKVEINMNALQQATSTQEARQTTATELSQAAKSTVKDVNIFQYSDAYNAVRQYVNSTIKFATNVSQECNTNSNITQEIVVQGTDKDVRITDNTQKSLAKVYANCLSKSIASSSTLQDIQAKIDQRAEAKTEGFDLVLLAFLAILAFALPLLIPLFGVGMAFNRVLKLIFPIFFVVGVILMVVWAVNTTPEVISNGFSKLIQYTDDCYGDVLDGYENGSTDYKSAAEAAKSCQDNDKCEGYDFKTFETKEGANTVKNPPETIFYRKIKNSPCTNITDTNDDIKIMVNRTVFWRDDDPLLSSFADDEGPKIGDVWMRTSTGQGEDDDGNPTDTQYSILTENGWENYTDWGIDKVSGDQQMKDNGPMSPDPKPLPDGWEPPRLTLEPNKKIFWVPADQGDTPADAADGDYIIRPAGGSNSTTSGYWNIKKMNAEGKEDLEAELGEPGQRPLTESEIKDVVNFSGFKQHKKDPVYLYIGIPFLIIGLLGTWQVFTSKKKSKVKPE